MIGSSRPWACSSSLGNGRSLCLAANTWSRSGPGSEPATFVNRSFDGSDDVTAPRRHRCAKVGLQRSTKESRRGVKKRSRTRLTCPFSQPDAGVLGKWTIEVIRRCDTAKGFEVLPRRWVVERTLRWFGRCRRLAKDWETSIKSSTAWTYIASIRLMTRRLAT